MGVQFHNRISDHQNVACVEEDGFMITPFILLIKHNRDMPLAGTSLQLLYTVKTNNPAISHCTIRRYIVGLYLGLFSEINRCVRAREKDGFP